MKWIIIQPVTQVNTFIECLLHTTLAFMDIATILLLLGLKREGNATQVEDDSLSPL